MKYRLLAPGPTPVPDRVLSTMARSIYHHRTPAFESIFSDCIEGLKWVFQTDYDVLTLSCSGTGAFEAIFQNFFQSKEKVITIGGGKFGERWGKMARAFGLNSVSINIPWGESVSVESVKDTLETHPDAKAVVCVASETSTGARHPYEEIGKLIKDNSNCLFIVDAITALGVWDISPNRENIDILVSGSQKAFMLPPGLAFMSVSPKGWEANKKSNQPRFYFDLKKEREAHKNLQTAYTPAVSLITGLRESLAMMKEEGLANIFSRHSRMAHATRAGIQALNLELLPKHPADSITAVYNPKELRDNCVYAGLRDRANITIAGGQDHLKGKIFRVAHMGYFDELDILTVLSAIEIILKQEGYQDFRAGDSIAAASTILEEGFKPSEQ